MLEGKGGFQGQRRRMGVSIAERKLRDRTPLHVLSRGEPMTF